MRDLPLWARAATAGLAVFASWWLVETAAIQSIVGLSVVWLGVGVVAASALRGMHVPLGLWPESATRTRFSPVWVIAAGAVVGVLLVFSRPASAPDLFLKLDRGRYALVIIGGLAWGFSLAFVKQQRFVPWYGVAIIAGLAPAGIELWAAGAFQSELCWYGAGNCRAGIAQVLAFSLAVITPSALVTVDLAFRRVLLGRLPGAGVLLVIAAALFAALWRVVLGLDAVTVVSASWWAGAAAIAGAIYALSGSLLVSSLYVGVLEGAALAAHLGSAARGWQTMGLGDWSTPALATQASIVVLLLLLVWRRNGLLGGMGKSAPPEAPAAVAED